MLKNVKNSNSKVTKSHSAIVKKASSGRVTAKKAVTKKKSTQSQSNRRFSTILTGNEDSALPFAPSRGKKSLHQKSPLQSDSNASSSLNQEQQPQQQQQQQSHDPSQLQTPQLDFTDPNVMHSVSAWNSFIRHKTSPAFQSAFQNLLVMYKVIPSPTKDDFLNPVRHIRRGLLAHGLVFEENDTRTLPDDIIALQAEAKAKSREDGGAISVEALFHLLDFFQIFLPSNAEEEASPVTYKPGLANPFIPHKQGDFTTDPTNFNADAVKAKIKANQRLGLDASIMQANTVLDIVGFCAEAAGGLDLREYVVTDNRPNSHVIFVEYLRSVPPPGDLLTSNFSDNNAFPFSAMHLRLFPDLAEGLNQISQVLEHEKSPQKLLQLSLRVSRRDIFAAWKRQNPEVASRFLQCGLNPLVGFNDEELGSIKGMILQQFIQNVLVNKYLFSPFQQTLYSMNLSSLMTQEQMGEYFKAHSDAVYDLEPNDTEEQKMIKKAKRHPDPSSIRAMTEFTETPAYTSIHSGANHLVLSPMNMVENKTLTTKFVETLHQQGVVDLQKIGQTLQEQFKPGPDGKTPADSETFSFMQRTLLDSMVKQGVLAKRTRKDDDDVSEPQYTKTRRQIVKVHFGPQITDAANKIDLVGDFEGVKIIDDETNEVVVVKTFEQEITHRLKRFGILDNTNTNDYMINTLTPLSLPQDPAADRALKDKIIKNKLLPVHTPGISIPTVIGQKELTPEQQQQLPPFMKVLIAASVAERAGGDNDPTTTQPTPATARTIEQFLSTGRGDVPDETEVDGLHRLTALQQKIEDVMKENGDISQLDIDQSLGQVHVVSAFKPDVDGGNPIKFTGWKRNLNNDKELADGAMLDVDRAIFKMDLTQLRDFTSRQFNHDIATYLAQSNLDLFTTFTRDMHTRSFPEEQMNDIRFMASLMATQSLLKAKFRETQDSIDNGKIEAPADGIFEYNHVLFVSRKELQESKEYFLDQSRF